MPLQAIIFGQDNLQSSMMVTLLAQLKMTEANGEFGCHQRNRLSRLGTGHRTNGFAIAPDGCATPNSVMFTVHDTNGDYVNGDLRWKGTPTEWL